MANAPTPAGKDEWQMPYPSGTENGKSPPYPGGDPRGCT